MAVQAVSSRQDRANWVRQDRQAAEVSLTKPHPELTSRKAQQFEPLEVSHNVSTPAPGPRDRRVPEFVPDFEPVLLGGAANDIERKNAALTFSAILMTVIALGIIGAVLRPSDESVVGVAAAEVRGVVEVAPPEALASVVPDPANDALARTVPPTTSPQVTTTTAPTTTTTTTTTTVPPTTIPLADRSLLRVDNVYGNIAPKSVTATPGGLFFAQNMMYRHSVTVYDDQGSLLRTIDDRVDLAAFGIEGGVVARGAPVEAAPNSDGSFVYVSNYAMYGPGFGPEPDDGCNDTGWDNSFVYRVGASDLEIDQVIEVGAVPKFLDVTPDDRLIVVANWCSFDVSIIDTASGVEVSRIDIGRHPRGIAISSDSSTAYVTEQGGSRIAVIDLDAIQQPDFAALAAGGSTDWAADLELEWIDDVGLGPRSLVLSPDDQFLYATLNGDGRVVKIDLETNTVQSGTRTGEAPRSMAISNDGEALYIVNYDSDSLSKVLTESMEEVEELTTADKPIGITVDPVSSNVWVSHYSGVLQIYEDQ